MESEQLNYHLEDMTKRNLNVIIVDDEKEACKNLKNLLLQYVDPDINIVGSAYDTKEAETQIKLFKPDAIFLDIEMPNENAFTFLKRIYPYEFDVVFVTAYDEYAIKAFKLNAVDYILKPISIDELTMAVKKLKEKNDYKSFIKTNTIELLEQIDSRKDQTKILLKGSNSMEVVAFVDILCVEASGSYSKIFFLNGKENKSIVMSRPIAEYEELLPPNLFYRIHKSFLVNCRQIEKLEKGDNCFVILKNKVKLPVSRRKYAGLISCLKKEGFND